MTISNLNFDVKLCKKLTIEDYRGKTIKLTYSSKSSFGQNEENH